MVNAAAGFARMRWDVYTLAMIPGCLAWAVALHGARRRGRAALFQTFTWWFAAALLLAVAVGVAVVAYSAPPKRRFRRAYSSIARHRSRRSTSGHSTSLNTISA